MLHVIIIIIVVVQSLSRVWLFATPWAATRQVSLFFTISQSVLKLMSIKSVMPSNHLVLCRPLFLLLSIFPSIGVFFNESTFSSDGKSIRWPVSQLQHQSFQWIFRVFLFCFVFVFSLWDWLVSSPWCPSYSQEVFSSTTVWKHQFFGVQPSLWSNSHIHAWILEKPYLWLYRPLLAKWCRLFNTLCRLVIIFFQGASSALSLGRFGICLGVKVRGKK